MVTLILFRQLPKRWIWKDGAFEENKKKVKEFQAKIFQKKKEIDQMVYELYGLTEVKIVLVKNSKIWIFVNSKSVLEIVAV